MFQAFKTTFINVLVNVVYPILVRIITNPDAFQHLKWKLRETAETILNSGSVSCKQLAIVHRILAMTSEAIDAHCQQRLENAKAAALSQIENAIPTPPGASPAKPPTDQFEIQAEKKPDDVSSSPV